MARPSKPANVIKGKHGKGKLRDRADEEEKLKGDVTKIKPSIILTKNQKKIFNFIVKSLEKSSILGGLDCYILERAAVCIDTLQQCEEVLNLEGLFDIEGSPHPAYKIKKEELTHFFRFVNELSLSPQARAKLANLNLQVKEDEEDLVLKTLGQVQE